VRAPGDPDYRNFKERYGVRCAGKFTNVHLDDGAMLELKVGGGGGYGPADERSPMLIARDLLEGFVDEEYVERNHPAQLSEALQLRDELLQELRARSGG
jgi:N-methylhydantoinase B/oxoprolinase/acetone carboxylase alpha subunit